MKEDSPDSGEVCRFTVLFSSSLIPHVSSIFPGLYRTRDRRTDLSCDVRQDFCTHTSVDVAEICERDERTIDRLDGSMDRLF